MSQSTEYSYIFGNVEAAFLQWKVFLQQLMACGCCFNLTYAVNIIITPIDVAGN